MMLKLFSELSMSNYYDTFMTACLIYNLYLIKLEC